MEKTILPNTAIKDYIVRCSGLPGLEEDLDIFASGIVNSLFVIQLMTFLEKEFGIKITIEDMDMNNFLSVGRITAFVERKQR